MTREIFALAPHATRLQRQGAITSYVSSAWHGWRATVLDPFYWAFLAALAALQLLWPAQQDQRRPSRALAEDAVWFLFSTLLVVTLLGACLAPLNLVYQHVAGGRTLDLTPTLGVWGVAVLAFVLADLLAWYSHWLHHDIGALWYFHAVHHSQTNLNVLSDNRQHFAETVVNAAIAYVPARILGLSSPDALRLAALTIYFSALIHTNLRTNLGPLRYVFVSPQVHRVHHSVSPEHFNSNYGTVFIFWDLLFRTHSGDFDVYPATGIDDPAFPHGRSLNPFSLIALWAKQTAHPFRLLLHGSSTYAGNVTQHHGKDDHGAQNTSVAVLDDAVAPVESPRSTVPRVASARVRAFAPVDLEALQQSVAESATSLALALEGVSEVCSVVADRIEQSEAGRRTLEEAIAGLAGAG
jgi:sterol desaturase/sphingolipid hydroxylase (fatty acid hydroxylase superfamily)